MSGSVRWVGVNEHGLSFSEFHRLFLLECRKEGLVVESRTDGLFMVARGFKYEQG